MDLKGFVDYFSPATCILSVEKKAGGGYGTIRINTGNGKYIDALALAAGGVEMDSEKKEEFIPNSEYTRYIPKDLNFEDVCYRCAVLKEPIHNCLRASRYPFDILVYMMPLESQDESIGYCTFSQVLIPKSDNNLMSLNISQQTATEVINTCIRLREDKPFNQIIQEVVEDIRTICDADYCSVLLLDENERKCTLLGEANVPDSGLATMQKYLDDDFFDLAMTWQPEFSRQLTLSKCDVCRAKIRGVMVALLEQAPDEQLASVDIVPKVRHKTAPLQPGTVLH